MDNSETTNYSPVTDCDEPCFWCNIKNSQVKIIDGIPFCQECYNEQYSKMNEYRDNRTRFYPEINKITDKIFLGNEDGQREIEILKENGVTHILICAYGLTVFHPDQFTYLTLEMDDSVKEKLDNFLVKGIKFIDEAEKVYVHCQAGISRSASIVIAYFMWKEKLTYEDAKSKVKQKRGCICPNSGFEFQLLKFEQNLKKNNFNLIE